MSPVTVLFAAFAAASALRGVACTASIWYVRLPGASRDAISEACTINQDVFQCEHVFETGAAGVFARGADRSDVARAFVGAQIGNDVLVTDTGDGTLHTERGMPVPQRALPSVASLTGRGLAEAARVDAPEPFATAFLREGVRRCREGLFDRTADALSACGSRPQVSTAVAANVTVYVLAGGGTDARHAEWDGAPAGTLEHGFGPGAPSESVCATWHSTHLAGLINGAVHGVAPAARVVVASASPGCRRALPIIRYLRALQWIVDERRKALNAVQRADTDSGRGPVGGAAVALVVPLVAIRRHDVVAASLVEDLVRVLVEELRTTVITGAGDAADDACAFTPARMKEAFAVAAVEVTISLRGTIMARPWAGTNFGKCVNGWAPGSHIESAQPTARNSLAVYSGTAQAAALTAGAAARFLAVAPWSQPAAVRAALTADRAARDTLIYSRPKTTRAVVQVPRGAHD